MVYTISMKTQRKSSMTQITSIDQQTVSMYLCDLCLLYTSTAMPASNVCCTLNLGGSILLCVAVQRIVKGLYWPKISWPKNVELRLEMLSGKQNKSARN